MLTKTVKAKRQIKNWRDVQARNTNCTNTAGQSHINIKNKKKSKIK